MQVKGRARWFGFVLLALCVVGSSGEADAAWRPSKPVEVMTMAGPGGAADIYARFIVKLIAAHKMAPVSFYVTNRAGGAGAVAMEHLYGKKGDDHTLLITVSSFLMTPINQSLPFNWRSFTPVARVAMDSFWLWVHKDAKWNSVAELVADAKERSFKVGGTGSKQEDELLLVFFEQQAGLRPFAYVPFKGVGAIIPALLGRHIEATVNNPSEGLPHYPEKLRILATFATERHTHAEYKHVPTMRELGYDVTYQMLRGFFGAPQMSPEATDYYVDLMKRVYELPEFQEFLTKNVLTPAFLSGAEFMKWMEEYEQLHWTIMRQAGWVK